MKQFKLREQKTFIKVLKEPPRQKKKTNWSRIIYLSLFVFVLFLVGRKMYNGHMMIFADGQIELPKQTINFPNDIQLLQLFIQEGHIVCRGDTLFAYKMLLDESEENNVLLSNQKPVDWIVKERMNIEQKLELNKIQIQNKKDLFQLLTKSIVLKESLLINGVHSEYKEYSDMQAHKAQVQATIAMLKKENKVYYNFIQKLIYSEAAYTKINSSKVEHYQEIKYFIAPLDGIVGDIFYQKNEICYKKEELLSIHKTEGANIKTYFDPNEIPYLKIGDQVAINFPDGSKGKGLISKFHISTYALPSEFQKKYEPTERNILAEVIPLDEEESKAWKSFYKMNVQVRKERYDLPILTGSFKF